MAMTVRLDDQVADWLRLYRMCTGKSANTLLNQLAREFFETGPGRAELERGLVEHTDLVERRVQEELRRHRVRAAARPAASEGPPISGG